MLRVRVGISELLVDALDELHGALDYLLGGVCRVGQRRQRRGRRPDVDVITVVNLIPRGRRWASKDLSHR